MGVNPVILPIVGRSEEPSMASPFEEVSTLWVILSGLYNVTDVQRKLWEPERMKNGVSGNKKIGSYKSSREFKVPRTTLERYVKGRQKISGEAV